MLVRNLYNILIFMIHWSSIAMLKVSPTDHSYDGLDNSSQGSTALAQVVI